MINSRRWDGAYGANSLACRSYPLSRMGSITALIADLKLGDPEAARKIWERYSAPLASLAQRYLPVWLQRVVDCDDVANIAYRSFVAGVQEGRFARLGDG